MVCPKKVGQLILTPVSPSKVSDKGGLAHSDPSFYSFYWYLLLRIFDLLADTSLPEDLQLCVDRF
jgi:hypothetical protein